MADQKFTIVMRRAPDYKVYPGDVFYGGPTPDADGILINVCVDHSAFPNYMTYDIQEGKVDQSQPPADQASVGNVEREMLCGISIGIKQAKQLAIWLTKTINNIESQTHE